MGWTIALEDENGLAFRTLSSEFDSNDIRNLDLGSFILLKYLDPYGDTTFNKLQLADLEIDFEILKNVIPNHEKAINNVLDLIKECREKVHGYINFYGD